MRAWRVDLRWVPSLREAGLLPLARMVEVAWEDDQDRVGGGHTSRSFPYDRCLPTVLVDRWRPETHTFHLPCGEMAPTLQDVSFLIGLPCAGFPMVAYDILVTWHTEFLSERMAEDALDHMVRRYFEVYLLWLFGWVMFVGPQQRRQVTYTPITTHASYLDYVTMFD
uniref:Putative retrotransposon protein n=1 Tax=Phyllostachys edulis TaxID=38705 RepID=D3IVJ2_PHYED|nr:putative retrotransposon protein [Phyllostachys edulis]